MENAILNLAINARDSMPRGGNLKITSKHRELDDAAAAALEDMIPGAYTLLEAADSGFGIESEILDRVFDPFYTTKEVGEGSGLGLSMVYGFAKQSGGHSTIHSEVDSGTTVSIYLPKPATE